jgi:GNAT superfamily N-acetyltransferase
MAPLDLLRTREAYDAQVRRSSDADGTGASVVSTPRIVRWVTVDGHGWSGITWSDLSPTDVDEAVAQQVAFFSARGQRFEWKLYDYDQPVDLCAHLLAARFTPEEEESLMVAEVAAVPADVHLPDGVRLVPVTDEAGVGLLIEVHERVFGTDHSHLRRSLVAQLRAAPAATALVLAMAGSEPVCSARIEFLPHRDFASLWGGGTVPHWRKRGIYRALVAYRAELARHRGYRYLQVDASAQSRPILEQLGFVALASTTPYVWEPSAQG